MDEQLLAGAEWLGRLTGSRPVSGRLIETIDCLGKRVEIHELVLEDDRGRRLVEEVVVKRYENGRATAAHDSITSLRRAGFEAPSRHRAPVSLAPGVERSAPGRPWIEYVADPRRREVATAAAEWLVALQRARGVDARIGGLGREATHLRAAAAEGLLPGAMIERLIGALADTDAQPVPSHGDWHPKNVLIDGDVVTVIDFDRFAMREPAYDVGSAIGQLLVMSWFGWGGIEAGTDAARVLWQEYAKEGRATTDRVGVHVARTLLDTTVYKHKLMSAAGKEPFELSPFLAVAEDCMHEGVEPALRLGAGGL